ncbi:uncharacterized protein N7459_001465 [Penicillium hispanicum]|uniref:uncharacterized protein n=1 Tax=Penicillium hispanicum TaxID=1080232 RepID=UPI0025408CD5|nr:uncharacterized protein N7459_001465 [Penicillium hispanicum]KAJ5595257.1 hypothetical protein N7459_001465 [Penicillium hispanicum]
MPKKHKRTFVTKPANTPHHSLASSGARHNDRLRQSTGSAAESPSVNDLISRLRRTQLPSPSSEQNPPSSSSSFASQRSVPPSLRNLLELPEPPPPRPRPDASRMAIGRRPIRRIPGPPPPESWLTGDQDEVSDTVKEDAIAAVESRNAIHRLKRLPGVAFPGERTLVHAILTSMAANWIWHLEYDGVFLSQIPSHLKVLLLSYLATHGRHQRLRGRMYGLKPLFLTETDYSEIGQEDTAITDDSVDTDAKITRLDLGHAIGHWLSFKQLTREVVVYGKSTTAAAQDKTEEAIPTSWDEEVPDEDSFIPQSIGQRLRFSNLRYLSLAHPHPSHASWNSLLQLLSHLSTITHLSLAHWPTPSRTSQRQDQLQNGSSRVAANQILNEWGESAGILRQLSRSTYCLKWLDLEGCSTWIPALTWSGLGPSDQPDRPGYYGPEWNASWRDVEWIGLAPGWQPDDPKTPDADANKPLASSEEYDNLARSLASSIHAPPQERLPVDAELTEETSLSPIDEIRRKMAVYQRRARDMQDRRDALNRAVEVHKQINEIRRKGRGKWMHATTGAERSSPAEF